MSVRARLISRVAIGLILTAAGTLIGAPGSLRAADGPPMIDSPLVASAVQGIAFTYKITANGTAPIVFTASGLPAGLSFAVDTIFGTPMVGGVATVTLAATNTVGVEIESLVITIDSAVPGSTPVFSAAPTATPNPADAATPVSFSAAAGTANGDILQFTWDFGDGSFGLGANCMHTYANFGIYHVKVSASAGNGSVSKTLNVGVNPPDDSVPGVFNATKMFIRLNLLHPPGGGDQMQLFGTVPVHQGGMLLGTPVSIAFGGQRSDFTLDSKGNGRDGSASIRLSAKAKGGVFTGTTAKFEYLVSMGTLQAALLELGFTNADVVKPGVRIDIPVVFSFGNISYFKVITVTYIAKKGKTGTAK